MTKHKWYNEIVAWAGGAEIEIKWDGGDWHETDKPTFNIDTNVNVEYRIKPQPKEPKYLYVYQDVGKLHFELDNVIVENMLCIGKIEVQDD